MRPLLATAVTAPHMGSPAARRARTWALHAVLTTTSASCAPATRGAAELRPRPEGTAAAPPVSPTPAEPAPAPALAQPLGQAGEAAPAGEPDPMPVRADPFEMAFVGDVIFGRYRARGYDAIAEAGTEAGTEADPHVFAEVAPLLRSHLTIGNLETPLVRELPAVSPIVSPAPFGASAEMARPLAAAGFHAMSVANNHAYDLRRAGLEETPRILAELGIVALGPARDEPPIVRVQTLEREGWRVGVLAVATRLNGRKPRGLPSIPLVPTLDFEAQLVPRVKEARASHDLLVVLVHWGEEYRGTPTSAQRWAAHALVDAGVDVVVGHHPHVLQGIERHGAGVIAYSLGNFLFDNPEELQRQTGVLRVRARGRARGCVDAVVFEPVILEVDAGMRPSPATGAEAQAIDDRLRRLSRAWGTGWVEREGSLTLDMPGCAP